MTLRLSFIALSLILPAASCKKTVGDTLRPEDHTAASATGAALACTETPGRIKPLVVDWTPDDRVDLEAAMQGSVVVVKYDCPKVEILPGCSVDGSYSYAGVSRKEQVIQMKNMDEVKANIPVSSGSVGGEIQSGRAIDLATVLVGRQSTTVNFLTSGLLAGQCEGATHFVRSASLGAFAMGTGSVGKAAVVAEMFGMGGGASSESNKQSLNKDGNLESCRDSAPDSDSPPAECRAPVRIELMPIAEDGANAKDAMEASKKAAAENPCLPGYVFADGLCTVPSADVATTCDPDDKDDCKAQCDKGSAESCFNYGRELAGSQAMVPLKKACDGEVFEACTRLGEIAFNDADPDNSNYKALTTTAFGLVSQGCDGGHGYGCELRGDIFSDQGAAEYDMAKAFRAYTRSCDLGSSFGCYAAAGQQLEGKGIPKDVGGGLKTLMRSCQGGNSDECNQLADIFGKGEHGVPVDDATAMKLHVVACKLETGYCEYAGNQAKKMGNWDDAATYYSLDCFQDDEGNNVGCAELGLMHMEGNGVEKDEAKAKAMLNKACDGYEEIACKALGRPVPE